MREDRQIRRNYVKEEKITNLNSLKISFFEGNKILNYLFNHPDREISPNDLPYKDLEKVTIRVIFILFICPILILLFSSFLTNTLFLRGKDVGFLEDIPIIEVIFLLALITFFSYLFFERFRKFFLDITQVIDFSKIKQEEYIEHVNKQSRLIRGTDEYLPYKIVLYILSSLGIFWWVFIYEWLYITFPYNVWHFYYYPLNYILISIYFIFILGFVIAPLLWRLLASAYSIKKFIKDHAKNIKLIPLSPDGVGGLRPLGDTVFSFHIVILLPMIHFIISLYVWGLTSGVKAGFVYLAVLIIIFFLPLVSSHNVMLEHKNKNLKKVSDEYKKLIEELKLFSDDKISQIDEDLEIMEKMDKIRNYYRDIEKMPVWPFDLGLISKFFTSILVPFILMLIQIYLLE